MNLVEMGALKPRLKMLSLNRLRIYSFDYSKDRFDSEFSSETRIIIRERAYLYYTGYGSKGVSQPMSGLSVSESRSCNFRVGSYVCLIGLTRQSARPAIH